MKSKRKRDAAVAIAVAECLESRRLLSGTGLVGAAGFRALPAAADTWIGPTTGTWDTPGNWSLGIPTAGEAVSIGTGFTVSAAGTDLAGALTTAATSVLQVLGGSLTLSGPASLSGALDVGAGTLNAQGNAISATAITFTNGTITGTSSLTVSGLFTWSGGTLSELSTVAEGGVSFGVTSGGQEILSGGTLTNVAAQTATFVPGNELGMENGTFTNDGTVTENGGTSSEIFNDGGGGSTNVFNNDGTFDAAGPFSFITGIALNNNGTVAVQSGTLTVNGGGTATSGSTYTVAAGATLTFGSGTQALNAGSSISGAGTVSFAGATVNDSGSYNVTGSTLVSFGTFNLENNTASVSTLVLSSGVITGTGSLTVNGLFTWSSGTLSESSTTANGGLNITGSGGVAVTGGTLTNASGQNATMTGGDVFLELTNGIFDNAGTFTGSSSAEIVNEGGSNIVNNTGTFNVTGPFIVGGSVAFNNSGTVEVKSGTLTLAGGGAATAATYLVDSGAMLNFDGGTFTFDSATSIRGAGTVTFTSATETINGTYDITGATAISGANVTFGAGSTVTSLGNGSLTVSSGTVTFDSSIAGVVNGALSVDGTVNLGTNSLNVTTVSFTGGTISGTGSLTAGGLFTWSSGTLSESSTTANGGLNITGSSDVAVIGGTLTNPAGQNATMTGGDVFLELTNGIFDNAGTFTGSSSAEIVNQGGSNAVNNTGTFNVTGPFIVGGSVAFNNSGTVEVKSGTLTLAGGGAATAATYLVDSGATLNFNGGTFTLNSATTIRGAGAVTFSGGTETLSDAYDITGATTFSGGAATFSAASVITSLGNGSLSVTSGSVTFNSSIAGLVTGALVVDGTLNLGSNSITPTTVSFTGGTISGTGSLTAGGLFTWSSGTLSELSTTANGGLNITGSSDVAVIGGTLTNPAGQNATMTGGDVFLELTNGIFDNAGTFTGSSSAEIVNQGGSNAVNNTGTFNVTGPFIVGGSVAFNNSGTVEVKSGTLTLAGGGAATAATYLVDSGAMLNFDGGTFTFDSATSIRGAGTVTFTSATETINGTYDITGATAISGANVTFGAGSTVTSLGNGSLTVSSGTVTFDSSIAGVVNGALSVDGTVNLGTNSLNVTTVSFTGGTISGTGSLTAGGLFTWSSGTLSESSTTANGGLNITGSSDVAVIGGTLTNPAGQNATMTGGDVFLELTNGIFDNAGTFTGSSSAEIVNQGGSNAVNNTGTFNVTGTFAIGGLVPFTNSGTLNLQASLNANGGFTQTSTGTTDVFVGGTTAGQFTQLLVTGSAKLAGTLAVTLTNSFTPSLGNSFKVLTVTSSITGQFSKYIGVVNGNTYLSPVYQTTDLLLTAVPTSAPSISSAPTVTFATSSTGTFTVTTTAAPPAALSESGALPSGVTFVDNGNGTATLSGTPAASTGGTYILTLTANNGITPNAAQSFTLTVDQAPAITSAPSNTFSAGTSGTFTVTTTGFPTAALTETGALPSGVTFVDNHNGTATLSGTPATGTGASYALTLTANNSVLPNATQSFTLTVDQSPSITSASAKVFTTGTVGTFSVTTSAFPAPTLTETGALPSGVTFVDNGNGTATLAGTPVAGSGATYPLTISASNGISPGATQFFTLTVNQAPAITSAPSSTFTTASSGTFTVTTTGFPTAALTESGALPSGVMFVDNHNGTATLSGTPAAGTGASYVLTLTANNAVAPNATQTFTLTVDQAPSITSAPAKVFTTGTAGTFSVTTSAFPIPTLTENGVLPSGVMFVDNGNGTATLSGTPAAGAGGVYGVTITAANGISPNAVQAFILTVDQAPAITSAPNTGFTAGAVGTFTVTTSGFPTAALTEVGALPGGVTFVDNGNGTATISGMPAAGTGPTYDFAITAANGVSPNANQTFTLTVGQPAAITSSNVSTFTTGTADSFTINTTGFPTPDVTETGTLPSGLSFFNGASDTAGETILSSNLPAGTAIVNINATKDGASESNGPQTLWYEPFGTSGLLEYTIQPGTYNLRVVDPSDAAALYPSLTATQLNSIYTGWSYNSPFVTNYLIFDSSALTNSSEPQLIYGASSLANSTSPQAAYNLAVSDGVYDTFYVGAEGSGTAQTQYTFTAPETLVFAIPDYDTNDNQDGVSVLISPVSGSGAIGSGSVTIAGTPAAGTGGEYPITLTASNGVGPPATQTLTLLVDQSPAITSSSSATFTTGTASSFVVDTTGFPAASLTETGTLPSGVNFVDNGDGTATLSGKPAATAGGTYSLTITGANGIGANATQIFTLTVDEAPAIAHVSNPTFTAGSQGSITITTTGFPDAALSETGSLPTGLTFVDNGNGTATLSGTPAATAGGTYVLTLTAANGVSPIATQTVTLSVDQAPAINSSSSTTFSLDEAGTFTVTTTALPNAAITESGDLPGGVTFLDNNNGTATISGTPTQVGTFPLTITAANGISPNADQSFTLTVIQPPGDSAPTITSASSIIFAAGLPSSFTVNATGVPNPSLMETGALPDGITFTDNGDGTASLAGTASLTAGATFPLSISASNNVGSPFVQSFTLTIEVPTITQADGVITGDGTDVNDVASVSYSNGNVVVTIDGLTEPFALSSVTGININLGAGDDSITLGASVPAVNFNGAAGNDSVVANNSAADTLAGAAGNDTIIGGGKGSSLTGNGGNDMVAPENHHETVNGAGGNDTVSGAGHDSMGGGGGDDIFLDGGMKKDSINGGAGLNFAQNNPTDTMNNIYEVIDPPAPVTPSVSGAAVSSAPSNLSADSLVGGPADASDAVTAGIVNGELKVTGTSGPDVISVTLNGAGTKLKVTGNGASAGSFKLSALTGIHINGGPGADSITISSSVTLPATLQGNGGADTLTGGGGDNVLIGGPGGDLLIGGAGTNLLVPDQNTSFINTPAGNDTLNGGTGFSIADFSRRTDQLTLSNDGQADSGGAGEQSDIMSNVSAIWGGTANDTIVGATPGEFLSGGDGANSIHGGGANDLLVGGGGNDTVIVAAEPVSLYLINGQPNDYGGVSHPAEDILQLDSLDTELA